MFFVNDLVIFRNGLRLIGTQKNIDRLEDEIRDDFVWSKSCKTKFIRFLKKLVPNDIIIMEKRILGIVISSEIYVFSETVLGGETIEIDD